MRTNIVKGIKNTLFKQSGNALAGTEIVTAQKIHADFDAEAESLLADRTISNDQKAERLKNIGFTSCKEVVSFEKKKKENEVYELARYYKIKYPFLKFLTGRQLTKLCDKYNLDRDLIQNYTGIIPEKNLREIEKFDSIDVSDIEKNEFYAIVDFSKTRIPLSESQFNLLMIGEKDFLEHKLRALGYYGDRSFEVESSYEEGLHIAAPESEFNAAHSNLSGFRRIGRVEIRRIGGVGFPDPVVYRYVKGGALIITKWGEESNDAELINELLN